MSVYNTLLSSMYTMDCKFCILLLSMFNVLACFFFCFYLVCIEQSYDQEVMTVNPYEDV
jgi:hypothetical protein